MSSGSHSTLVARSGLVRAGLLKYKALPKVEDLDHGIEPHEYNVLVLPREIEDKTASGLIHLPQDNLEREQDAAIEGLLVAISPAAFTYAEYPPSAAKPQVGQLVYFKRYAGTLIEGDDQRKYRVVTDKDIIAVRTKDRQEFQGAW